MEAVTIWKEPWTLRVDPIAITDRLFYVGNQDVSCHLVKTPAGAILIDTAYAQTAYLLTESIRRVGVDPDDIRIILHTHGHVDHCGATRRMKELSGADVCLGEADVPTVQEGLPLTCAGYWYGMTDFETFTVDRPLRHGDTVELGGLAIRCHHTPGHTAGVMTFTFDLPVVEFGDLEVLTELLEEELFRGGDLPVLPRGEHRLRVRLDLLEPVVHLPLPPLVDRPQALHVEEGRVHRLPHDVGEREAHGRGLVDLVEAHLPHLALDADRDADRGQVLPNPDGALPAPRGQVVREHALLHPLDVGLALRHGPLRDELVEVARNVLAVDARRERDALLRQGDWELEPLVHPAEVGHEEEDPLLRREGQAGLGHGGAHRLRSQKGMGRTAARFKRPRGTRAR